jgi:enamine deaminase RidA (YjgF/YER057c/UK114 family)
MTAVHDLVNSESLTAPIGFSHAVVAAPGRTIHLGGQVAHDPEGRVHGETMAAQFALALDNVLEALRAAGGRAEHLVSLQIFVTDVEAYRAARSELGQCWKDRLGRHYPAMALLGVTELFDPAAMVELVGVAVVPEAA